MFAGNKIRRLAVEVKATKDDKKYFSSVEVKQLLVFSNYFGAEPWIAIKFLNSGWVFVNPEDLDKTKENYVFSQRRQLTKKGLCFEEVIRFI